MHTVTKQDIASEIVKDINCTGADAAFYVETIIGLMKQAIFNRASVYIPCVCKIITTVKSPRPGRNPRNGNEYIIDTRHSVRISSIRGIENGKLTKQKLLAHFINMTGTTNKVANKVIDCFYDCIGMIQTGEYRVEIRGLGTFYSKTMPEKPARNPKTGLPVITKVKVKPMFRVSPALRKAMDREYLCS